jgi:AMME syndrome candidate gene 1 protein
MCFEALDAELNSRKPLTLDQVQSSWTAYTSSKASLQQAASGSDGTHSAAPQKDPVLRRLAADSDSSSSSSSSSLAAASATPATSTSSLSLTPASAPLFVTWNTVDPDEPDDASLRGCIGTFEAQPLSVGLPEYAVISAMHDSRFPPVSRSELPTLQAAVTLLTDFEEVEDPFDWDIGVHGIRLSFWDRGRRYGSTYLPDVAAEQGWTKEETLFSLIRKAGWMGGRTRWRDLELKVTRYQGRKVSAEYPAFKKWKDWVATQA